MRAVGSLFVDAHADEPFAAEHGACGYNHSRCDDRQLSQKNHVVLTRSLGRSRFESATAHVPICRSRSVAASLIAHRLPARCFVYVASFIYFDEAYFDAPFDEPSESIQMRTSLVASWTLTRSDSLALAKA